MPEEPTEEEFNWLRCLTDQRKYNLYYRVSDMNSGASVSWVQVNPEITGTDLNSLKHYLQGFNCWLSNGLGRCQS